MLRRESRSRRRSGRVPGRNHEGRQSFLDNEKRPRSRPVRSQRLCHRNLQGPIRFWQFTFPNPPGSFDDKFWGYTETNYENTEIAIDFDHSGDEQFNDVAGAGLDAERWEGALTQNYRWQLHIEGELFLWGAAPWV